MRFIHRAKALGFSLSEIEELLAPDGREKVRAVRAAAGRKLADLDHRLLKLTRIRQSLAMLVDRCPGEGPTASCPILSALNREEDRRE